MIYNVLVLISAGHTLAWSEGVRNLYVSWAVTGHCCCCCCWGRHKQNIVRIYCSSSGSRFSVVCFSPIMFWCHSVLSGRYECATCKNVSVFTWNKCGWNLLGSKRWKKWLKSWGKLCRPPPYTHAVQEWLFAGPLAGTNFGYACTRCNAQLAFVFTGNKLAFRGYIVRALATNLHAVRPQWHAVHRHILSGVYPGYAPGMHCRKHGVCTSVYRVLTEKLTVHCAADLSSLVGMWQNSHQGKIKCCAGDNVWAIFDTRALWSQSPPPPRLILMPCANPPPPPALCILAAWPLQLCLYLLLSASKHVPHSEQCDAVAEDAIRYYRLYEGPTACLCSANVGSVLFTVGKVLEVPPKTNSN